MRWVTSRLERLCPLGISNPSAGQTAGRTASEWAGNPGLDPRRKVSKQRARGSATYVVEKRLAEKQPLQLRRQKTPQRRRIPFQAWRALVDVAMAENFFTAPLCARCDCPALSDGRTTAKPSGGPPPPKTRNRSHSDN